MNSVRVFFLVAAIRVQAILASAGHEPLFLTPLLKSDKIQEARDLSDVRPLLPNVRSNAGYLTVDETFDANLFFWFFSKTANNWQETPVVLWLQGGPGCSSLYGLFAENGPFEVTADGLKRRKHAWTNEYNTLYVDNPVGAGFSFARDEGGYVTNEEDASRHLLEALTQFFQLFPRLKRNELYLAGESMGCKFVTALARLIRNTPRSAINLKGLLIGNGVCDPENMMDYSAHLHRFGLIDYEYKKELEPLEERVKTLIRARSWEEACDEWKFVTDRIRNMTGFTNMLYDYEHEKFKCDGSYAEYLEQIRESIHVGNRNFTHCSSKVKKLFKKKMPQSVKYYVTELLRHYKMMFYVGQTDIVCGYALTENFLRKLNYAGVGQYSTAKRKKWYVRGRLAGYYKVGGNLSDALIRDANHMAGFYHPDFTLDLLHKFITNTL